MPPELAHDEGGRLMRKLRTAILAGVAALAAAGTAMAANQDTHVINVALPDGSVARVEYQGDVAPKVTVDPVTRSAPVRIFAFDPAPFDLFDRIAAKMDQQAEAVLRQARTLQAQPFAAGARPEFVASGDLPPGTVSYSFVSTSDGDRVCTRSWRMTSTGPNQQPKVVSTSSGDCGPDAKNLTETLARKGVTSAKAKARAAAPALPSTDPSRVI
jgi:hypothetical protein